MTPSHLQCCPQMQRSGLTFRHNATAGALYALALQQGLAAKQEPHVPLKPEAEANGSAARADLLIGCHDRLLYIDVSTLCSTAPSYLNKKPEAAIKYREHSKLAHYANITDAQVLPVVYDAYGSRGEMVDKVINIIRKSASVNVASFKQHARRTLAFALQRGNALAEEAALVKMSLARGVG